MRVDKVLYEIGVDVGIGKDVCVEDRYIKPSAEYPDGSWLHIVNGEVTIATGYYSYEYPDKPSPYWHGGPPFVFIDTSEWPWERKRSEDQTCTALSVRSL
jgi:hypothetical protein